MAPPIKTTAVTLVLLMLHINALSSAAPVDIDGEELRDWTDVQGRKITAALVAVEGDSVKVKMGGKVYTVLLSQLSEADRGYVRAVAQKRSPSPPATSTQRPPVLSAAERKQVEGSIAGLKTGNIKSRRAAAADLAKLGPKAAPAVAALIESLKVSQQEVEPDPSGAVGSGMAGVVARSPVLMGACCEALLSVGSPARDQLLEGLGNSNQWTRCGCAWVLGRLGDKSAVPPLMRLLNKKERRFVIVQVAESLSLLGDPQAVPAAIKALEDIPLGGGGFRALLKFLAEVDPPAASKWCVALSGSGEPDELRSLAAEIAGKLKDEASLKVLLQALNDPKTTYQACLSLGERDVKEAVPELARVAEDNSNPNIRIEAAWAIGRMGDPRGAAILRDLAASGPEKHVRSKAQESLETLEAGQTSNRRKGTADPHKFGPRFVNLDGTYVRID